MSKKKNIHYTLCGLEYVYILNAPINEEDGEEYIDIAPDKIDRMIAQEIIKKGLALRGKEIQFLRKALNDLFLNSF